VSDYFGVKVAGWHTAFPEGEIEFFHDDCIPAKEDDPAGGLFPISDDDTEWDWQPVCATCHQPLTVNLSDHALSAAGLIPAAV
jgi:hypothetical protein